MQGEIIQMNHNHVTEPPAGTIDNQPSRNCSLVGLALRTERTSETSQAASRRHCIVSRRGLYCYSKTVESVLVVG